jgi:hypothetical protein
MLDALAVAFHDPFVYDLVTLSVRSYWVLCTAAALVALLPPRTGLNWFRYVTPSFLPSALFRSSAPRATCMPHLTRISHASHTHLTRISHASHTHLAWTAPLS